jgi:hypothetical protein
MVDNTSGHDLNESQPELTISKTVPGVSHDEREPNNVTDGQDAKSDQGRNAQEAPPSLEIDRDDLNNDYPPENA